MLPGSRFTSRLRHCLMAYGIFFLCGYASAKPDESSVSYRKVIVRVVGENGEPIPGAKVQLLGTGRDALQAMDMDSGYNLPGVWRFVSDAHGRCTIRFGCFKGFDSMKLVGRDEPGWGRFNLIAEAGRLRGVSSCILHEPDGEGAGGDDFDDEWKRMGVVKTLHHPVLVTLRMRQGVRLGGRVVDTAGKPVRGFDVGVYHDLHSQHHTGYGNEIFRQSAKTDSAGHFVLDHVFPNTFYLDVPLREEALPVLVRTRLRGKWSSEPVAMITPHRGEKVIGMTLVVSRELPYHYRGRILDEEDKPVSGAAIVLGISRHRVSQNWEDDHASLPTKSDDAGRFEFHTATPFVRWLSIKADGFTDEWRDYEEKDKKAPRQWNITLHRPQE